MAPEGEGGMKSRAAGCDGLCGVGPAGLMDVACWHAKAGTWSADQILEALWRYRRVADDVQAPGFGMLHLRQPAS